MNETNKNFIKRFRKFKDDIDNVGLKEEGEGYNMDDAIKLFEIKERKGEKTE